ncbi:MAG: DUF1178 domain-containing protein [Chelatococcus sp.]|nr:MAG: DUF1178 domain-containing protein [Chelatococcus sp.]
MILYTLICEKAHEFESWFPDSAGFEKQAKRGLVSCPHCGSTQVERAVMAPNVARTDRERSGRGETRPVAAATAPAALLGEKEAALRQMLAELHRHVAENAEHVGPRFAEEALKIHNGETDARAIYGEASPEDARMLHDEGVEFMPLPRLPDSGN